MPMESAPHQSPEEGGAQKPEQVERRAEGSEHDTPRIYVASLLDHTHGELHGAWIDADQDLEDIEAEVAAMLAASPTAARLGEVAEDWAIHDFGGGGLERLPLGEYRSLAEITRIARLLSEHGEAF